MCGIAGILSQPGTKVPDTTLAEMLSRLAHRGPDGDGRFERGSVQLGHRRLKIIDLEGGRQPMTNEDGALWITYNGELYNYRELRPELEAMGHLFRTQSDTEVILHAYEQWGPDCVLRFRGMFAFAVADFRLGRVFLARDHFGIKPLFYRQHSKGLAFASELNALRAAPGPPLVGSRQAVEFFLRYQYIPAPYSIFKDVHKLPPAHWLMTDLHGQSLSIKEYWRPSDLAEPATAMSTAAAVDKTEEIILESVRAHLVADVPFGVLLSGGIDSTLVAWCMARVLGRRVKAFSIGFQEETHSELRFAEHVARQLDLEWHTEVIRGLRFEDVTPLLLRYGEPFGDSSALPTWQVAQLARNQVPMVLGGDGGDEGFAGYHSYAEWLERQQPGRFWRCLRQGNARGAARCLIDALARSPAGVRWERVISYSRLLERSRLWRPEFRSVVETPCAPFARAAELSQPFDQLRFAQSMDYCTYLPNDILTKVDIATMAHGLEARVPLIDLAVTQFAFQLPWEARVNPAGHPGGWTGKFLLKELVAKHFGREFAYRRKQGFAIPLREWLCSGGPAYSEALPLLSDRQSRVFDLLDRNRLHRLQETVSNGQGNYRLLWLVIVLALWMEDNPEVSFR